MGRQASEAARHGRHGGAVLGRVMGLVAWEARVTVRRETGKVRMAGEC